MIGVPDVHAMSRKPPVLLLVCRSVERTIINEIYVSVSEDQCLSVIAEKYVNIINRYNAFAWYVHKPLPNHRKTVPVPPNSCH